MQIDIIYHQKDIGTHRGPGRGPKRGPWDHIWYHFLKVEVFNDFITNWLQMSLDELIWVLKGHWGPWDHIWYHVLKFEVF